MSDLIETAPRMDVSVHDIEHLVEELCASHAIYSPLFQRREQREAAHPSLQGLWATWPRKAIEPMVLAVDGVAPTAVRAIQSFISEGRWNDGRLVHQHWKDVERDLGADDGVLMVDGSELPAIPGGRPNPVTTPASQLAFRKHPYDNTPLTGTFQTPPDLVVKFQHIDIADVILRWVLRPHVVDQREIKG